MEIVPGITAGRRTLGVCVMTIVPLLQLATEYLGTGDRGRAISKLAVTIVGLPILIGGSSAGLRWAAGRRSGPLGVLLRGDRSHRTRPAALPRLAGRPLAPFAPRRRRDADAGRADRLAAPLRADPRGTARRPPHIPLGSGRGDAWSASPMAAAATAARERGHARGAGTQGRRRDRSASRAGGREDA